MINKEALFEMLRLVTNEWKQSLLMTDPYNIIHGRRAVQRLCRILELPFDITPIDSYLQADIMRKIRNSGRESFSHDSHDITVEEQKKWWDENGSTAIGFIYHELVDDGKLYGKPVGYAILIKKPTGYWSSMGFLPEHRGKGYGKAVLHHLIRMIPGDVWAEARKDQPAACKTHPPTDWEMWKDDGTHLHFHTWKGRDKKCASKKKSL